jgi:hypothetical protein
MVEHLDRLARLKRGELGPEEAAEVEAANAAFEARLAQIRGEGWYLLAKCAGITRSGAACKGIPIEGSQWCYVHHPDHADERRRHGSKGGKRGGRGRPVAELGALRDENADIRRRLLEGELQPNVAAVAVQSINTDIRAVGVVLKAREQEELIERLETLETALEQRKGERRYGA